jgi:hypothetical protein
VDGDESMWDDDVSLPPHDKDHMDVDWSHIDARKNMLASAQ